MSPPDPGGCCEGRVWGMGRRCGVEQAIAPDKFIATHYVNNVPAQGVQFQRCNSILCKPVNRSRGNEEMRCLCEGSAVAEQT